MTTETSLRPHPGTRCRAAWQRRLLLTPGCLLDTEAQLAGLPHTDQRGLGDTRDPELPAQPCPVHTTHLLPPYPPTPLLPPCFISFPRLSARHHS